MEKKYDSLISLFPMLLFQTKVLKGMVHFQGRQLKCFSFPYQSNLLLRSIFFRFRIYRGQHFFQGSGVQKSAQVVREIISLCQNRRKVFELYSFPLNQFLTFRHQNHGQNEILFGFFLRTAKYVHPINHGFPIM